MNTRRVSTLLALPPAGNLSEPFHQLDWLMEHFLAKYSNDETKRSFLDGMATYYKPFTMQINNPVSSQRPFALTVDFHNLSVYDYFHWLKGKALAPLTIKKLVREFTALIKHVIAQGWLAPLALVKPNTAQARRATQLYDPYSIEELNFISRAIQPGLDLARKHRQGYLRTGVGYDPRTRRHNRLADGTRVGHWSDWNNIVWFFENVLECKAQTASELERAGHRYFVEHGLKHHGGLDAAYKRLGVVLPGSPEVMVPLLIKLAWETGLNPTSLLKLKRDCYQQEHPLTGQPYLRYYKERSQGEKELHLALFDIKPFPNGQMPDSGVRILSGEAARLIKQTVELILSVTEPIREHAPPECENDLFLIRRSKDLAGKSDAHSPYLVETMDSNDLSAAWCEGHRCMLPKYGGSGIEDEQHVAPRYFNLVRFRSTLADQLVRDGVDFFAVQAVLGHTRIGTTASYLRTHLLEGPIRQELDTHLQKIHRNMQELDANPKPYATMENIVRLGRDGVIYKGILCDCKNVYSPPANIQALLKQAAAWEEGKPCAYYDMCLLCDNLLITRRSLPMIVRYAHEIRDSNVSITPGAKLYAKKLAVLDDVLKYFTPEEIAWAEEIAVEGSQVLDPFTYQGHDDA